MWERAVINDAWMGGEVVETFLGWPENGGVWVLRETWDDSEGRAVARIKLAKTMEERCRAIEMSGGTFYLDAKDCDATRDTDQDTALLIWL